MHEHTCLQVQECLALARLLRTSPHGRKARERDEERQAALTDALRKGSSLEASLSDARSKEASAQATADERRAKIEECQELLSSNQRLISWLNSQVNEAQLGRIGVPSRASFGSTTLPVHASATTSHIPASSASLPMTSGGGPSRYTFRPSIAIPLAGK